MKARKIATAPVLHVYWITKILEAAVRLGRVNPVFGRLDLSGDEAP